MRTALSILFQLLVFLQVTNAKTDSAPIFILERTSDGYAVEKLTVNSGESILIKPETYDGLIDMILPAGTGGSGNMVKSNWFERIKVSFDGTTINSEYKSKNGKIIESPPQILEDLQNYYIHVSVTGADGSIAAFVIRGYDTVTEDHTGPVMDMFRGKVPMSTGDYSLCFNTESRPRDYDLTGEASLFFSGKYLFGEVVTPDGRKGLFAIDIGATVSVMVESFLPDDLEIRESYMMEYSGGQQRRLKYTPSGGTGPIETVVGHATISHLDMGTLRFDNAEVDVIKSLPELHERKVDGIIGLNLLKAARYLTLIYDKNDSSGSKLILSNEIPANQNELHLPFVCIRGLMYVRGQISKRDVCFVLDSGSPICMFTPSGAEELNISLNDSDTLTYKGGGGQVVQGQRGHLESISLAGHAIENVPCVIGNLFNLSMISKGRIGGMLGNELFSRFKAMTLDFDDDILRFEN